jgi:hypothetical protein
MVTVKVSAGSWSAVEDIDGHLTSTMLPALD